MKNKLTNNTQDTDTDHMDAFKEKYDELQSFGEEDPLSESLLKIPYMYYSSC